MTIETAAIRLADGTVHTVPRPGRHHTIIGIIKSNEALRGSTQGFVTSEGNFVGREDAARIAIAAGQITDTNWGTSLYSEDLW